MTILGVMLLSFQLVISIDRKTYCVRSSKDVGLDNLVLEECPYCHRLLAAEQISKEEVDFTEEGMLETPPETMGNPPGLIGAGRTKGAHYGSTPVDLFTTYKVSYRCKHCGKEWSKTRTEEKEIARSRAGTEQATSEEVARDEQMAKEEQYAEE